MNSIRVDDIAAPSADAWKPEIGDILKGTIIYAAEMHGESYDKKKTEAKLRIVIQQDDGTEATIFATTNTDIHGDGYAKRDARAVAAAVRAAGATTLEVGGTLAMKRGDDFPTDFGPAKTFTAEYQPPKAGTAPTEDQNDGAVTGLI